MHTEAQDTTRRRLLWEVLAAGCTVTLPSLIGDCDQNGAPSGGTTPAGRGGAESASRTGKLRNAQVKDQEQRSGDQRGSNGRQFIAESKTCKAVDDPIDPQGRCTVWRKIA